MTPEQFKVGSRMVLAGKTRKGKNRIHEHGTEWVIEEITDKVGFSDHRGPWALVTPVASEHPKRNDSSRWINLNHNEDPNFRIL
jgi:hypothetical protein